MKSRTASLVKGFAIMASVVAMLFLPVNLRAQEVRGKITGRVLDPNKAAMPGASVKVTDVARGTTVSLTTNDEGLFQANYLLSGTYQVVVEIMGFKKYIQDGVLLQISETRDLDIMLEVGGTTETVTVTAEAGDLNTADANLEQTLDRKRIEELPVPHGDPYKLMGLGTGTTFTGNARLDRPYEPTHIIGYAIDGTRGNRSDLLIDGAPSTATANANEVIATYVPPSDIVQEFKVQTATFNAQFGSTEGGVTSISIKSGTNDFHGTVYRWTEPQGSQGNDFFGKARGEGRPGGYSNRPGYSVSGPVRIPKVYDGRDKTFFLFGFERITEARTRNDTTGVWVPTAKLRNGDFSDYICVTPTTPGCVTIFDPATRNANSSTSTAFPGNIIPANRISNAAKALLTFYPQPKHPGLLNNFFDNNVLEATDYDTYTFRVDQKVSDNNRLFVRGSWYKRQSHAGEFLNSEASGNNFQFISRQGVIDDVHTFNGTTVLNFRYGYNRFVRNSGQEPDAQNWDLTRTGFPAAYNNLVDDANRTFPQFAFGNPGMFSTAGGTTSGLRPVWGHTFAATVDKSFGAHSLKFGSELRIYVENSADTSADRSGRYDFNNTYTRQSTVAANDVNGLQAYASFLLGLASTTQIARRTDYSEYSKTWGFFVQDDWRFNNKLTLNLGLRYEVETPLVERNNKAVSGFDFDYVQPIEGTVQTRYAALNDPALKALLPTINVRGGLLFAGKDTGSGLYETPKNTFLPRLGFAYQWNDKTVIRGGFGLFAGFLGQRRGGYGPNAPNDVFQPGFSQTTTLGTTTNAQGGAIPFGMDNAFLLNAIREPVGNALGKQTALGTQITFFDRNPKVSKQARFQIGFQRELPGGWVAEAAYVFNRGYDIEIVKNINTLPNKYLNTDNSRSAAMTANNTFLGGLVTNPFQGLLPGGGFPNPTIARSQLLRPFPVFGDIQTTNNDGKTWYHAGQFNLQKRFSKGYTVAAGYTWSKWIQATEYLNAGDETTTRMIADQDSPHRITFNALYEIPFGKGQRFLSSSNWLSNAVFGGWQLSGTVQLQSGFPVPFGSFNITQGTTGGDLFYNGGDLAIPSSQRGTYKWFNTAAFTSILNATNTNSTPVSHLRSLPYRFASVRRDYFKNIDLALKKDIHLRESMKIQLRLEALNATNEPFFPNPVVSPTNVGSVNNAFGVCNNTVASPCIGSFGTISASNVDNWQRRIQYGLKFIF